jgi:hypothetical protein
LNDEHELGDRKALKETATGKTPYQVAKLFITVSSTNATLNGLAYIEGTANPAISISSQPGVSPEAIQGSRSCRNFIHSAQRDID